MKLRKPVLFVSLSSLLGTAGAASPPPDLWYLTRIAGKPVGFLHQTTSQNPRGGWTSLVQSKVVLNRLGKSVAISTKSAYDEDANGHLRSVSSEISTSHQTTKFSAEMGPSAVTIVTHAGGREYKRSIPSSGDLLGTIGVTELLAGKLKAPGNSVNYQTFDGTSAALETWAIKATGKEEVVFQGHKTTALIVHQTVTGIPGETTSVIMPDGTMLNVSSETPFGKMVSERCDARTALAAASGSSLPDESYGRTLVMANVRLPHERNLDEVRIELTHLRPNSAGPRSTSQIRRSCPRLATGLSSWFDDRRPTLHLRLRPGMALNRSWSRTPWCSQTTRR